MLIIIIFNYKIRKINLIIMNPMMNFIFKLNKFKINEQDYQKGNYIRFIKNKLNNNSNYLNLIMHLLKV